LRGSDLFDGRDRSRDQLIEPMPPFRDRGDELAVSERIALHFRDALLHFDRELRAVQASSLSNRQDYKFS